MVEVIDGEWRYSTPSPSAPSTDKNVKAILVNVFGGIVNCATIANGIVNASKSISLDLPLVVRLEGERAAAAGRQQ